MAIFLPFNFNPESVVQFSDESYSYTIPAGKYAIVSYSLQCSSHTRAAATGASGSESNSIAGTLYLNAGESLTRAVGAPSGTSSSVASYANTASCSLKVDTNIVAELVVTAVSTLGSSLAHTYGASASVHASIAIYAIP